jgi:hypothetical protein
MCNGFTAMGIFMESLCYHRDCESSSLCCYCICKRDIQFYSPLDPDCYRIYMLPGHFDRASTYSSTSALILILSRHDSLFI